MLKTADRLKKDNNVEGFKRFQQLVKFVCNEKYSSVGIANDLANFVFQRHYYDSEIIADKFDLTVKNLYVQVNRISDDFYKLFGNDILELLEDKEDIEKQKEFVNRINNSYNYLRSYKDYIIPSIYSHLELTDKKFEIDDCTKELEFIKKYAPFNIYKELSGLSEDKLSYLIGVLKLKDLTSEKRTIIDKLNEESYIVANEDKSEDKDNSKRKLKVVSSKNKKEVDYSDEIVESTQDEEDVINFN